MECLQSFGADHTGSFSTQETEPPHVHVERDDNEAKLWLEPVRLQRSSGFGRTEINRIIRIVEENRERLAASWDNYFNE